jgi:preprotein translocase subunit YajC
MRIILATLTALGVVIAAPAAAQSVGMPIVDTAGAPVGTVMAINGDNLQVKTDKHEVLLPKASFTLNNGKLLFGMTQAELNSKIEESEAAAQKAIAAGATVNGTGGKAVGKIEAVETDTATLALDSGKKIRVPKDALRGNPDGTVTIGYTADQLDALVNGNSATAGK